MSKISLENLILEVFTDPKYAYPNMFRYVSTGEFKSIFIDKELSFKNPTEWIPSDNFECYFERWWDDDDNIKLFIERAVAASTKRWSSVSTVATSMICADLYQMLRHLLAMRGNKHCLCLASTYKNRKMKDEYHGKYSRNIVIEFSSDFLGKMAPVKEHFHIPSNHLYVDIFPISYIADFSAFCDELCTPELIGDKNKWGNTFYNKGHFLKHKNYDYEHEIRATLRTTNRNADTIIYSQDLTIKVMQLQGSSSIETDIFSVYKRYKGLIDIEMKKLPQTPSIKALISIPLNQIVEKVFFSDKCSGAELADTSAILRGHGIPFAVVDFDKCCVD